MDPVQDWPGGGFEQWRSETLAPELAGDLARFVKYTVPATSQGRLDVFHRILDRFAALAHDAHLAEEYAALTSIPAADLSHPLVEQVRQDTLQVFWRAAWRTAEEHQDALAELPRVPPAEVLRHSLPCSRWRGQDDENRLTLAFWLLPEPAYRAGLCLWEMLSHSHEIVCFALDRTQGATDALLCRARDRFREYYTCLEQLSSPPFPVCLAEALNGAPEQPLAERDKQHLLDSALQWLRKELRNRGGN